VPTEEDTSASTVTLTETTETKEPEEPYAAVTALEEEQKTEDTT
jgi:hypothetical protein